MNNFMNLEEVSLDGFQIVNSEMFSHLSRIMEASCSIWPTRIAFNKIAIKLLNNCEYVRIEVNPVNKRLLVIPVTSSDKDSIRWVKGKKDLSSRYLESRTFGDQIYKAWGLNTEYNYRTTGRLVSSKNKVMLLFDFNQAEKWVTKKLEN